MDGFTSLLVALMPLVFAVGLVGLGWNIFKVVRRVVGFEDYDRPSGPQGPYSRETPEEALQRAKRRRIVVEHETWDHDFHSVDPTANRCPHCSGPKSRTHYRTTGYA